MKTIYLHGQIPTLLKVDAWDAYRIVPREDASYYVIDGLCAQTGLSAVLCYYDDPRIAKDDLCAIERALESHQVAAPEELEDVYEILARSVVRGDLTVEQVVRGIHKQRERINQDR